MDGYSAYTKNIKVIDKAMHNGVFMISMMLILCVTSLQMQKVRFRSGLQFKTTSC